MVLAGWAFVGMENEDKAAHEAAQHRVLLDGPIKAGWWWGYDERKNETVIVRYEAGWFEIYGSQVARQV